MKGKDLLKIFPGLKGRPVTVHIGSSRHQVVLDRIEDHRVTGGQNSVYVYTVDDQLIYGSTIDKIEFDNNPTPPKDGTEYPRSPGTLF